MDDKKKNLEHLLKNLIRYRNGYLAFEELEYSIKKMTHKSNSEFVKDELPCILYTIRFYPNRIDIINKIISYIEIELWNTELKQYSHDLIYMGQ